jgi:type I restriction enzyme M protein
MGFKRSSYPFLKTDLYRLLWSRCNALRGDMDASQYKDYVLAMLFVKYVSSRYTGVRDPAITIPEGAGFKDMVALKGRGDIGDQINRKIIAPLVSANYLLGMPDFNDTTKLGDGTEMVNRLTSLIGIFEGIDLGTNTTGAEGNNVAADCWEYLMGRFATDCPQGKGQFYTPLEVSRLMAQVIGIGNARTTDAATVYDPTCGSGSLLLQVANRATAHVTLYGQERDWTTVTLARMNMILQNAPTAFIVQGNSLANPILTRRGDNLMTFDYVVAHPPFADSSWSGGFDALNDPHSRFQKLGAPPVRQGDFAYLLHIVRSLKSKGKGACILPQGALFRGSSEAEIRRNLVRKGYIKGIIGLPANLFYGTGIPSCIVVIDKFDAHNRKGVFIVDARVGFLKAGRKNCLREMDLRRIADVFERQVIIPGYSRMVAVSEIGKNQFNLNISRYINREAA